MHEQKASVDELTLTDEELVDRRLSVKQQRGLELLKSRSPLSSASAECSSSSSSSSLLNWKPQFSDVYPMNVTSLVSEVSDMAGRMSDESTDERKELEKEDLSAMLSPEEIELRKKQSRIKVSAWLDGKESRLKLRCECPKTTSPSGSSSPSSALYYSKEPPLIYEAIFTLEDLLLLGMDTRYTLKKLCKLIRKSLEYSMEYDELYTYRIVCFVIIYETTVILDIKECGFLDETFTYQLPLTLISLTIEEKLKQSTKKIEELMEMIDEMSKQKDLQKRRILSLTTELAQSKIKIRTLESEKQDYRSRLIRLRKSKSSGALLMNIAELSDEENYDGDGRILFNAEDIPSSSDHVSYSSSSLSFIPSLSKTMSVVSASSSVRDLRMTEQLLPPLLPAAKSVPIGDKVPTLKSSVSSPPSSRRFRVISPPVRSLVFMKTEHSLIEEDGKVLTHLGGFYTAFVNGVFRRGSHFVDFKIEKSHEEWMMFGVVQSSESRLEGCFGDPLLGAGIKVSTGSLFYPPKEKVSDFADNCKVGDSVRVSLTIESSDRATVSWFRDKDTPLGKTVDLSACNIDVSKGLKFAAVVSWPGDQIRILN